MGDWSKCAAVKSWTYNQNQEVLDTTILGDTDRTIIDGIRSATGSCSLYYYNFEDDSSEDTGAGRLLKKILKPASQWNPNFNTGSQQTGEGDTKTRSNPTAFRLAANKDLSQIDSTGGSTEKFIWVGAWITSFTMTMSVGEVLSCDVTFEVNGAPADNTFSIYGD